MELLRNLLAFLHNSKGNKVLPKQLHRSKEILEENVLAHIYYTYHQHYHYYHHI